MVVGEDQRRGIVRQSLAQHLPGVHPRTVDRAAEQLLEGDEAVAVVEEQTAEDFVGPIAQLRNEKSPRGFGSAERRPYAQRLAEMSPGELQRRFQNGIARRSDSRLRATALGFGIQQHAQRAELRDQRARQLHRRMAAGARPEQQREQLRIRERVRAALEQFLAWPLGTRPVTDAHYRWI